MKFKYHKPGDLPDRITQKILEHAHQKVVLFVGGGSLFNMLPDLFAKLHDAGQNLDFLSIAITDERYNQDPNHDDSNILQLKEIPQAKLLLEAGAQIIPVLEKGLSLEQAAQKYDEYVTQVLDDRQTYTLAVVGIGSDGHFAGILPHREEYYQKFNTGYVNGYDIEDVAIIDNPHRFRITINYKAMKALDDVSVYAVGNQKLKVLKNLLGMKSPTSRDISRQTVYFFHELNQDLDIYTDQQVHDK